MVQGMVQGHPKELPSSKKKRYLGTFEYFGVPGASASKIFFGKTLPGKVRTRTTRHV